MPSRLVRSLVPAALVAALALVVVLARQNQALSAQTVNLRRQMTQPVPGLALPTFRTATLSGDSVTVGERADGGRQVLFVFTTTCPYCRASIPAWKRIAAAADSMAPPLSAVAYGVVLDSSDAAARQYVAAHALTYPVLRFPSRKLGAMYRTRNVPATLVLDAEGRVLYAKMGVLTDPAAVDSVLFALHWQEPAPTPQSGAVAAQRRPSR